MRIKEYKNKIVINELEPNCRYICLVDPTLISFDNLPKSKRIWYVPVRGNIDKAVKFIGVPIAKKWYQFWK